MTFSRKDLVSIVIPCHNAGPLVGEAIDSALNQTHTNIEVIVVNDGSTDTSPDIIASYGDAIRTAAQPNRGPSAARNAGLQMARGDLVQFLDADDLLLPSKIEVCLAAMPLGMQVPFVLKEFIEWPISAPSQTPTLLSVDSHSDWDPDSPTAVLTTRIGTPAPLHRTSMVRKIGGWNEDLRNREDVELHFRLVLAGAHFCKVDQVLVRCRVDQGVDRLRTAHDAETQAVRGEIAIYDIASREGVLDGQVKGVIADRLAMSGRRAYEKGHTAEAKDAFAIARTLTRFPKPSSSPAFNVLAQFLGLERSSGVSRWLHRVQRTTP